MPPAQRRRRRRHLGHAHVSSAARPAFYALRPGGWRDYVTLLHPPYTLWHLSYVAIGAALAPRMQWGLLGWTTLAFLLAMGIGAHALDELQGRPLRTRIPGGVLIALAAVSIGAACAIGIVVATQSTLWLLAFVAFGGVVVVAYNLELFGGALHSRLLVRGRLGGVPRADGVLRLGRAHPGRGGRGGRVRVPRQPRPAAALDRGAARPARRRRAAAGRRAAAPRAGDRAAAALGGPPAARRALCCSRASAEQTRTMPAVSLTTAFEIAGAVSVVLAALALAAAAARVVPAGWCSIVAAGLISAAAVIAWIYVRAAAGHESSPSQPRCSPRARSPPGRRSSCAQHFAGPRRSMRTWPTRRRRCSHSSTRKRPTAPKSSNGRSHAHARTPSRCSSRKNAGSRNSAGASSPTVNATPSHRSPKRSRRRRRRSSSGSLLGRRISTAQPRRRRRVIAELAQRQKRLLADVEARIETEAERLVTESDEQRAAVARMRAEIEKALEEALDGRARRAR